MSVWERMKNRRDERLRLVQLNYDREALIKAHVHKVKERGWKTGDPDYQAASAQLSNELDIVNVSALRGSGLLSQMLNRRTKLKT